MSYPLRGIRVRLTARFVAGFATLLVLGGVALYLVLDRAYRADFDRRLRESARAAQGLYDHDRPEFPSPMAAAAHIVTELIFPDRAIAAIGPNGRQFAVSRRYEGAPAIEELDGRAPPDRPTTVRLSSGPARWFSVPVSRDIRLDMAMSLLPLERQLRRLRLILALGLPAVLLAGGAIGLVGARSALRPIESVAASADRIAAEVAAGATTFVPLPEHTVGDEISRLTSAFNRLVERLGQAFTRERTAAERQRQFLADAAHELRTPVAILQSQAEVALGSDLSAEEYREALTGMASEARNLSSIVGNLLLLARADADAAPKTRSRVYLDDLVNDVFARVRALPMACAGTGQPRLRRGEFEAAPVQGDPDLLQRAILALMENALIHGYPAPVEVSTGVDGGDGAKTAWIRVRDWGPGIPVGKEEAIFERFQRFNPAAPGSGLGLPIARWIARMHGGTLAVDRPPDGGAAFTLRVPAA
ncbi:MAG: HAMP domain-containing sensor histidine kinase [Gemmatimonadota bacterium]